MNHDIPYNVQANWYATHFIAAQNFGTVVYINTHGLGGYRLLAETTSPTSTEDPERILRFPEIAVSSRGAPTD